MCSILTKISAIAPSIELRENMNPETSPTEPKRTCVICGKKFTGKSNAKTCGQSCRLKLSRDRKRLTLSPDDVRLYELLRANMPDVYSSISRLAFLYGQDAAKEGLSIVRAFQRAIAGKR